LFFRLAYEASGGSFGPAKFFFGYLIVPAFIMIAQITVMNHDGYKTLPQLERKIEKEQDYTRDVSDDQMCIRGVDKLTCIPARSMILTMS
jgi:hypothetical protein